MQWLGALAPIALSSESTAVSADGTVVVGTSHVHGTPAYRAFLWTPDAGMRDLKEALEQDAGLDLTGWNLTIATGISANGRVIVGNGFSPAGNQTSWIARLGAPGCEGDVNADGVTNAADFVVLAANFGAGPGASRSQGDLSGEGVVSSADFTMLIADFGCDQN
jgi:probable HAF family extracellular repeat protein